MTFETLLKKSHLILTECAISERLRRQPDIELHPTLFNTPLIYESNGRKRLEEIYRSYREVARQAKLPILLCAPTWRLDKDRIDEAGAPSSINQDAVTFMKRFRSRYDSEDSRIIAGHCSRLKMIATLHRQHWGDVSHQSSTAGRSINWLMQPPR